MTNIQMKDSGIEWIGKIPEHWEISVIKKHLKMKIKDGPHETPEYVDGEDGIPFITISDIKDNSLDLNNVKNRITEKDFKLYKKKVSLKSGDILFSKAATIGKTIIVKDENFMIWSTFAVIRFKGNICNRFANYFLQSEVFKNYAISQSNHNTQNNLGMRKIGDSKFPLTSLAEQTAIANYLDHHTFKIDSEVDYLEKKATLLEEFKQSLIFETVTKGLDKSVPMKDSGIEWIGKIPKHWVVKRIKDLCRVNTGSTPDRKQENYFSNSEGLPWIKPEDLNSRNITTPSEFITKEGLKFIKKYPARSLIISGIGNIGKIGITNFESTTNQQNHILHSLNKMSEIYLYYYLTASNNELKNTSKGNVLSILNASKLKNFLTLYPNLSEQKQIADYLDKECGIIDTKVNYYRKKAKLLKEYKQSLIYEAVTGKIEIPKEFF